MRVTIGTSGATLHRETGDKSISHETTTVHHFRRLLNAQGWHFVRFNPSKCALTGCTLGLIDRKAKVILWHERYAIEDAAQEFNKSKQVFFARTEAN